MHGTMSVVEEYHIDFTNASSWEVFISKIEQIFVQWKLNDVQKKTALKDGEFGKLVWNISHENITFADTKFILTWHSGCLSEKTDDQMPDPTVYEENYKLPAIEDMESSQHDFSGDDANTHVLAKWYGLRDFLVLTPHQDLTSEIKMKTLLSSFNIAADNTKCEIPVFVRIREPWQKLYLGVCVGQGKRVNFEMVHLERVPHDCKHLTGLSSIFKSSLTAEGRNINQIVFSVKLSYLLTNWTSFEWSEKLIDLESIVDDKSPQLGILPFGTLYEPLSMMCLNAIWSEVMDNVVIDNETYTDFDPNQAPVWTLSIVKYDKISCLLSEYLIEFIQFCNYSGRSEEHLGYPAVKDSSSEYVESLAILTESKIPKLSDFLFTDSLSKKPSENPIPKSILINILSYLFPDESVNKGCAYNLTWQEDTSNQRHKTCCEDSLVWRLSVSMAHVVHSFGGPKGAGYLWHEFSQELRFRWNSNMLIPGVAPGLPDPKTCLLHQKLQMINCCIKKKLERSQALMNASESEDSEEEEFFDCASDDSGVEESEGGEGRRPSSASRQATSTTPAGRLAPHPTLKLLGSGQRLFIPVTQGDVPKTEDQLEEDEEALLKLGPGAEGSLMRAKLMSVSLLSDMEAFKAANPGAVIEDFIRWYSPRDWIEKDEVDEAGQKTGELSSRMQLPGNTWLEVWSAARAVPARKQKRLFDDTREAERALHLVETALPSEAGRLLLPVLLNAATNRLSDEVRRLACPSLLAGLDRLSRKTLNRSRQSTGDIYMYQDMIGDIVHLEGSVAQVKSLEYKFQTECSKLPLIGDLVAGTEVTLPDGPNSPIASRIRLMFAESYKVEQMLDYEESASGEEQAQQSQEAEGSVWKSAYMKPALKNYILREKGKGNKLAVCLTNSDITMASALVQDTVFF